MELAILKKKIDGFRAPNGSIQKVSPEVLWELRQAWENFTGAPEEFRRELGVKQGTLRNLLVESKKLNHVMASAGGLDLAGTSGENNSSANEAPGGDAPRSSLELVYDRGEKIIRFPSVDTLIDFLKRAS
jgi:hypothetical protein